MPCAQSFPPSALADSDRVADPQNGVWADDDLLQRLDPVDPSVLVPTMALVETGPTVDAVVAEVAGQVVVARAAKDPVGQSVDSAGAAGVSAIAAVIGGVIRSSPAPPRTPPKSLATVTRSSPLPRSIHTCQWSMSVTVSFPDPAHTWSPWRRRLTWSSPPNVKITSDARVPTIRSSPRGPENGGPLSSVALRQLLVSRLALLRCRPTGDCGGFDDRGSCRRGTSPAVPQQ